MKLLQDVRERRLPVPSRRAAMAGSTAAQICYYHESNQFCYVSQWCVYVAILSNLVSTFDAGIRHKEEGLHRVKQVKTKTKYGF